MRIATVSALLVSTLASTLALQAAAPVPRPSKEFTIVMPNGKQTLLSSYRGKVVMAAFMFTTCPHCQALSKVITKLQGELGPRGFQALGVAFNDEVNTPNNGVNGQVTANFVNQFQVGFPMGYAPARERAQLSGRIGNRELGGAAGRDRRPQGRDPRAERIARDDGVADRDLPAEVPGRTAGRGRGEIGCAVEGCS